MVIGIVGIVLLSRLHEALGELAAAWPPLEGGGSKLPQERLPMRKIKEVLRLQSLGLSQRQIAASCAVGQATVSDYLKTAEAAGLRWPDIAEWSEDQVMQAVAPSREKPGQRNQSPEPDYAAIRHELQTHKHVTLQLLWEEYRENHPEGYRYSRFQLSRVNISIQIGLGLPQQGKATRYVWSSHGRSRPAGTIAASRHRATNVYPRGGQVRFGAVTADTPKDSCR